MRPTRLHCVLILCSIFLIKFAFAQDLEETEAVTEPNPIENPVLTEDETLIPEISVVERTEFATDQTKSDEALAEQIEQNRILELINERLRREIETLALLYETSTESAWWKVLLVGGSFSVVFFFLGYLSGRSRSTKSNMM